MYSLKKWVSKETGNISFSINNIGTKSGTWIYDSRKGVFSESLNELNLCGDLDSMINMYGKRESIEEIAQSDSLDELIKVAKMDLLLDK